MKTASKFSVEQCALKSEFNFSNSHEFVVGFMRQKVRDFVASAAAKDWHELVQF